MLHANFVALCFVEGELLTSEVCGDKGIRPFCSCDLDLDPMTFIYELDPYSLDIHTAYAYINFLRQGFRKLSSDIHTYIQYIQTHRQDRHDRNLYTTPLGG